MRDSTAFAAAPGRLLLLSLAIGGAQLEAGCGQFAVPFNASPAASLPAEPGGARRVPLDLAFTPGEDRLTRAASEALQQLLKRAHEVGLDREGLLVVGYAAPTETRSTEQLALAHDRADAVARQLRRAGLAPDRIRAAQSSPTDGHESFARVELWLRE